MSKKNSEKEKAYLRDYYLKNKKKMIKRSGEWKIKNRGNNFVIELNKRNRELGFPMINKQEFLEWYDSQFKKCSYCDIPESLLGDKLFGINTVFLSMDKINPLGGYVMGNMALSCMRCNKLKDNFFDFNETREIAQKYVKPKWVSKL